MAFNFNLDDEDNLNFGDVLGEIDEIESKEEGLNLDDIPLEFSDIVKDMEVDEPKDKDKSKQNKQDDKDMVKNTKAQDKKYKKTKTKTYKEKKDEEELAKKVTAEAVKTDEKEYTSPTYPTDEQVKDKLTTSAYYKGLYKKSGIFDKTINNLTMDNLKYVIPGHMEDILLQRNGFMNDLSRLKNTKEYKAIKDAMPDKLFGGGEDGIIPTEAIDFKKTYNSEARAS